jgi:hypothetical protein
MSDRTHPLDRLEVSQRVLKRAEYEALAFFIRPPYVEVRNHSYIDPENHTYRVRIADGIPVNCTCPADIRYRRACKHRVGVAIRPRVLDKVADGSAGTDQRSEELSGASEVGDDDSPDECECHGEDHLPCRACGDASRKPPTRSH